MPDNGRPGGREQKRPWTADRVMAELRARGLVDPSGGIAMKELFGVAKAARDLALPAVEALLAEPSYAARMAGVCVLDLQARRRPGQPELVDAYLRNHDRIDDWGMVDRAAPWVVGSAVTGGPYDLLHDLADSAEPIRRRTAITAPLWFVKYGSDADVEAGFAIAERLHADPEPLVNKAVGIWLAHAGDRQRDRLLGFLGEFASAMARPAARLARRKL
ncbi:hypothetical protein Nm8I071_23780 [Nonomuraea sp. TT08I-71]|nr:hypothetical protein Nm8I071_23780 [Nonomuraea sp. TT08I-71]